MNERDNARMEENCNFAESEYFADKTHIDSEHNQVFRAGFKRAWEAAISGKMCDGNWIPPTPFVQP